MDVIDRLRTLLRPCAWVRDSATALRLVPELAVDLPTPVDVITAEGTSERGVPVRCVETLVGPVATVVIQLGEAALESKPREELHRATPDRILADPLVPVVAELLAQASGPGLNGQAVPALAVAWLSSRLLAGQPGELKGRNPELYARMTKLYARLAELPPQRRGSALSDITWGLRGRLAAAVSVAQAAGWTVEAGGIYRRVMADPLVLAFPRGTLDDHIPFGVLSVLLGLPLEESLAGSIEKAATAVLPALVDRRVRGKATPTDDALASAFAADMAAAPNARGVLFDIWSGPLLIASLPDLADTRLLQKAGVSKEVSAALMRREVVRALAASWRDLVTSLLGWDVMSALISRLIPLRFERGRWSTATARLPPHARWDLLIPRSALPAQRAAVVAVNLGALRVRVARVAQDRQQPILAGAADSAWNRLVADAPGGLFTTVSDRGVGVFSSPLAALAFANRATKALSGPSSIPLGYLGEPIDVPQGVVCSVGVSVGEIRGGTDGASVWLDGPAVAEAILLTGAGEPDIPSESDPSGIRAATSAPDGLRSRGVVCSGTAVASLVLEVRERNLAVHVRGKGGAAGGMAEDFEFYPLTAWWETDDGALSVALALAGPTGPHELLAMSRDGLSNLHNADVGYAAEQRAARQPRAGQGAAPKAGGLSGALGGIGGGGGGGFSAFGGGSEVAAGYGGGGFASPSAAASDPFANAEDFSSSDSWSSGTTNPRPTTMPTWNAQPAPAPPAPRPAPAPTPAPAPAPAPAPRAAAPSGGPPAASWAAPAAPAAVPAARLSAPNPKPSAPPDDFGFFPSAPSATRSTELENDGFVDPFADFETQPGPQTPAPVPSSLSALRAAADPFSATPSAAPAPARPAPAPARPALVTSTDPFSVSNSGPHSVPSSVSSSGSSSSSARAVPAASSEDPGLEYFEAPTAADPGDIFSDAYDGPSVSIEEDEGWGGESALRTADIQGEAHPSAPRSVEPDEPEPTDGSQLAWGDDFLTGFGHTKDPTPPPTDDDPFSFAAQQGGADVLRTENILELDASGGGGLGFSKGAGEAGYGAVDIADRITAESGGQLLEAEGGGFAFVDEEGGGSSFGFATLDEGEEGDSAYSGVLEAQRLAPALRPAHPPDLPPSLTPIPEAAMEKVGSVNPITWGDLVSLTGASPITPNAPQPLTGDVELSLGGEPFGEDPFPDGDTGAGLISGVDISFGTGEGQAEHDPLSDFPFAPTDGDGDGLPEWETGGFDIEEPEDPPSVPSGKLLPNVAAVAVGTPSAPLAPEDQPASGAPDFAYLFMGYVVYVDRGEHVFGRPYGRLLVDAHAYPGTLKVEAAYLSFLKDKVREGFVPRTDMTRPYPTGQPGQKLEPRLLNRAYRAMI